MAYLLLANDTVSDGIRRIVQEEIESATHLLARRSTSNQDEAIHEARKSVKKIRAILRLVRSEIGETYKGENTHFRKIGRKLSELRDAVAVLEVFDQLSKGFTDPLVHEVASPIRRRLEGEKNELEAERDAGKVIQKTVATLKSAGKRLKKWQLGVGDFESLVPGLKRSYRSGRKALAAAEKKQTAEAFHLLRKRVKDHWYHTRLLGGIDSKAMHTREADLKQLETWLGDDHNLAVLRDKLDDDPKRYGNASGVQAFLLFAARQQDELRTNSLSLARRLYAQKPSAFAKKLAQLWQRQHPHPVSSAPTKKSAGVKRSKQSAA